MSQATTSTRPLGLSSPFTRLPCELRLTIYSFALRSLLDDVPLGGSVFWRRHGRPRRPEYRGALALLQVNRSIRAESPGEILAVAQAEHVRLRDKYESAMDDYFSSADLVDMEIALMAQNKAEMAMEILDVMSFMLVRCMSAREE